MARGSSIAHACVSLALVVLAGCDPQTNSDADSGSPGGLLALSSRTPSQIQESYLEVAVPEDLIEANQQVRLFTGWARTAIAELNTELFRTPGDISCQRVSIDSLQHLDAVVTEWEAFDTHTADLEDAIKVSLERFQEPASSGDVMTVLYQDQVATFENAFIEFTRLIIDVRTVVDELARLRVRLQERVAECRRLEAIIAARASTETETPLEKETITRAATTITRRALRAVAAPGVNSGRSVGGRNIADEEGRKRLC